jgi:hypothetical protein
MEPVLKSVERGGHPHQAVRRPTNLCLDMCGHTMTMPCMHAIVEPQRLPARCSRQCGYFGMGPVDAMGQPEGTR